jgi:hypothetical protein
MTLRQLSLYMEQLTKTTSVLNLLALLHARSLNQRINSNSYRINELERAREEQAMQMDKMLFMIGHLRGIIRRALEENAAVRNAINTLCFTLRLVFSRRGSITPGKKTILTGVIALLLARLLQKLIGVELILSFSSMAFSNKKWRSAFIRTGNAVVYATLAYYLYAPVARYMY